MKTQVLVLAALTACGGRRDGAPAAGSGSQPPSPATPNRSDPAPDVGSARSDRASDAGSGTARPVPEAHPEDARLGANIALAVLGGRVVAPLAGASAEGEPAHLIDGFPVIRGAGIVKTSAGWRSTSRQFPQDVVLELAGGREATISTIVVDTTSTDNLQRPHAVPKEIELHVSTTSATEGFTRVGALAFPEVAGEAALRFAPAKARFVKLTIAATHEGDPPQLGEVQVYEAAGAASVVAEVERDLLRPALGGSLVRFTSQAPHGLAYFLIDGVANETSGWSSSASAAGPATHLPQELTFAFRDHRPAFVDRVVVDPTSGIHGFSGKLPHVATWATKIEVAVSTDSPWRGFRSLGVRPVDGKPVVVPVGAEIRYLQVRILEANRGDRVTLGEVQAFEGRSPGPSITAGRTPPLVLGDATTAGVAERSTRKEREPNDAIASADPLAAAETVGGALAPAGDRDVFRIPGGTTEQTLTVELEGRPVIRTHARITDATGAVRYEHDPTRARMRDRFSVTAGPGDLFVELSQPAGAQVVIWDTSGSMKGRVEDLDAALRGYLAGIRPGDRVNLVRFDDDVEVLLKEFSDQPAALLGALKGKVFYDGGTSIFDAITKGGELLANVEGNRAIVMMTDGEDTTSRSDPSALWAGLQHGGVRLYTIGLGNGLRNFVVRAGATAERTLANAAEMTGGRYLFVADSARIGTLYGRIAGELRTPATYAVAARASGETGTLAVATIGERIALPLRVELVLDASGSMKRKVGGKPMMQIAQSALAKVVARLPDDAQVALRVYGHRTPDGRPKACEDSQLVLPFGRLDRARLTSRINSIKALGTTPIAYSIAAAGADLAGTKGPAMLILVTDGKEECGGDPKAAVAALRKSGLDVTLDIVGFALADAADRDFMAGVAGAGGGTFFDAKDEAALESAVDRALAVPFSVVDASGSAVARGSVGGPPIALPAGTFSVRVETTGTPLVIEQVTVEPKQPTRIELKKDGDEVGIAIVAGRSQP
jgi:Mg-chelatase subunit ChlD